jgi:hypothetical protein
MRQGLRLIGVNVRAGESRRVDSQCSSSGLHRPQSPDVVFSSRHPAMRDDRSPADHALSALQFPDTACPNWPLTPLDDQPIGDGEGSEDIVGTELNGSHQDFGPEDWETARRLAPHLHPVPDLTSEHEYGRLIRPGHSRWCKCPSADVRAQQAQRNAALGQRADPQLQSLISKLPREIRLLIFQQVWKVSGYGLGVHVCFDIKSRRYYQTPCITDLDHGAEWRRRPAKAVKRPRPPKHDQSRSWRNSSSWFNHWKCDALADRRSMMEHIWSPFLPVLLTCKGL